MKDKIDVLYIEDNPNDVELTLRAFTKNNFNINIRVINDGAEAYKFLFSNKDYFADYNNFPNVILLDLNLPKVSGLEILKALKEDEQLKLIPVVVLTSSNHESDVIRSY